MKEKKGGGLPYIHSPILSTGPTVQGLFKSSARYTFNGAFKKKANAMICY